MSLIQGIFTFRCEMY